MAQSEAARRFPVRVHAYCYVFFPMNVSLAILPIVFVATESTVPPIKPPISGTALPNLIP